MELSKGLNHQVALLPPGFNFFLVVNFSSLDVPKDILVFVCLVNSESLRVNVLTRTKKKLECCLEELSYLYPRSEHHALRDQVYHPVRGCDRTC